MAEGKPRCDERVARVLQSAGLSEFEGVFAAEHVDFEALLVITVEDLADMGLRKGHVAKLRSNLLALYGSPRRKRARYADVGAGAGAAGDIGNKANGGWVDPAIEALFKARPRLRAFVAGTADIERGEGDRGADEESEEDMLLDENPENAHSDEFDDFRFEEAEAEAGPAGGGEAPSPAAAPPLPTAAKVVSRKEGELEGTWQDVLIRMESTTNLGFRLRGGSLEVQSVAEDSPLWGKLRVGDRLRSAGSTDLTGFTPDRLRGELRSLRTPCDLGVQRFVPGKIAVEVRHPVREDEVLVLKVGPGQKLKKVVKYVCREWNLTVEGAKLHHRGDAYGDLKCTFREAKIPDGAKLILDARAPLTLR